MSFNPSIPHSDCIKDENSIINYGPNGASRDAYAVRQCSNNGFWGIQPGAFRDCGNWEFQSNCQDKRPSDWSPCFRDEEARNAGFANRDAQGNSWCQSNGFVGKGSQFHDCGAYYYSFQCANPSWATGWVDEGCLNGTRKYSARVNANGLDWDIAADFMIRQTPVSQWGSEFVSISKENRGVNGMFVILLLNKNDCPTPGWLTGWIDEGCQGNGNRKFSAKVNANGWDWDIAADYMIKQTPSSQWGSQFVSISKENRGVNGMFVVVLLNKNDCFIYNNPPNKDNCTDIHSRQMAQQCNNWPNGWVASSDVVNACKKNAPLGSTVKQLGSQVWATWNVTDNTCDTVEFSPYTEICDSNGASLKASHCTNWFNNNPNSCLDSINVPTFAPTTLVPVTSITTTTTLKPTTTTTTLKPTTTTTTLKPTTTTTTLKPTTTTTTLKPTTTTVPTITLAPIKNISGRFIKISNTEPSCLNFAEIVVTSSLNGENIALNSIVTQGSFYNATSYPSSNFVDGNLNNFGHTSCKTDDIPWILIDLGGVKPIYSIKLIGRNSFDSRLSGLSIEVQDSSKKTIYKSNPIPTTGTISHTYTVNPPILQPYGI